MLNGVDVEGVGCASERARACGRPQRTNLTAAVVLAEMKWRWVRARAAGDRGSGSPAMAARMTRGVRETRRAWRTASEPGVGVSGSEGGRGGRTYDVPRNMHRELPVWQKCTRVRARNAYGRSAFAGQGFGGGWRGAPACSAHRIPAFPLPLNQPPHGALHPHLLSPSPSRLRGGDPLAIVGRLHDRSSLIWVVLGCAASSLWSRFIAVCREVGGKCRCARCRGVG